MKFCYTAILIAAVSVIRQSCAMHYGMNAAAELTRAAEERAAAERAAAAQKLEGPNKGMDVSKPAVKAAQVEAARVPPVNGGDQPIDAFVNGHEADASDRYMDGSLWTYENSIRDANLKEKGYTKRYSKKASVSGNAIWYEAPGWVSPDYSQPDQEKGWFNQVWGWFNQVWGKGGKVEQRLRAGRSEPGKPRTEQSL